jgi:hypothetical protein
MVVKFRNTICPPPLHRTFPFIGELRCQAIQTEHGPYIEERIQKAAYCDMSMAETDTQYCGTLYGFTDSRITFEAFKTRLLLFSSCVFYRLHAHVNFPPRKIYEWQYDPTAYVIAK